MKINTMTMLFEDLTQEERDFLLSVSEEIVLKGRLPYPIPEIIQTWLDIFGYDDDKWLIAGSVSLPQRMLLSVINYDNVY
jgi:hypothetical protein